MPRTAAYATLPTLKQKVIRRPICRTSRNALHDLSVDFDYGMTVMIALIVIIALALLSIGLTIYIVMSRRSQRPDLVIHITEPQIKPAHARGEWLLDFPAEFANVSHERVSIRSIRACVSAPGQAPLEAKRILGDESRKHYHGSHPPDITLRLPIVIEPGHRQGYRFQIFFMHSISHIWDKGLLHLYAATERGRVVEGIRTLKPPESEAPAAGSPQ